MRRLLIALLLAPAPGFAQGLSPLSPNANSSLSQCGPAMDGQVMCRFGALYECAFISPNTMERRTGWRWKMDLLRTCDTAPTPASLPNGDHGSLPPGFTYAPQTNDYGASSGQSRLQTTPSSGRSGRHDLSAR